MCLFKCFFFFEKSENVRIPVTKPKSFKLLFSLKVYSGNSDTSNSDSSHYPPPIAKNIILSKNWKQKLSASCTWKTKSDGSLTDIHIDVMNYFIKILSQRPREWATESIITISHINVIRTFFYRNFDTWNDYIYMYHLSQKT